MLITVWLGSNSTRSWLTAPVSGSTNRGLPLVDIGDLASLPPRWALNTTEAIQSGVIYTIIAGIETLLRHGGRIFPRLCYFNWGFAPAADVSPISPPKRST